MGYNAFTMSSNVQFVVKIVIVIAVFGVILMSVDRDMLFNTISKVTPATYLILIGMVFVQAGFLGYRWHLITRQVGGVLPIGSSYSGTLVSFFFSQGLPSSVGGDVQRIWWLKARHDIPVGQAARSVLLDRVAGLVSLLILCAVSVVLLERRVDSEIFDRLGTLLMITIAGGLGILALAVVPFRYGVSQWLRTLSDRMPKRFSQFLLWLVAFRENFVGLRPGPATAIMLIGVTIHLVSVALGYVVTRDLVLGLTFLDCVALIAPALLLSYLPISIAGWGVREASLIGAFSLMGVSLEAGLTVSLILGFSFLITSLFGGLLWLFSGARGTWVRGGGTALTKPETPPLSRQ